MALHSKKAASLAPSCYILLVESSLIDMAGSVLWPNRECRKLSVLLVTNASKQLKGFVQKGRISNFGRFSFFFRIELIFGRLTCFDLKSIVP